VTGVPRFACGTHKGGTKKPLDVDCEGPISV
jgi:hypothetical protein